MKDKTDWTKYGRHNKIVQHGTGENNIRPVSTAGKGDRDRSANETFKKNIDDLYCVKCQKRFKSSKRDDGLCEYCGDPNKSFCANLHDPEQDDWLCVDGRCEKEDCRHHLVNRRKRDEEK